MSGRRGQGQMPNFDASFSRRPTNNTSQNISSLLGEPPSSQSKNSNYSKNPFASGNNGGGNYNDNYSRRDSFPSGGGNQNFGGNNNSGRSNQRMSDDFSGRQGGGSGGGNFGQQNRFDQQGGGNNNQQDAFVSGWGQRAPSPNRFNNRGNESPPVARDRNPAWSTNQNPGMDFDNNAKQQHLLAQQNLFNAEISRFRDGGNASNNSMQGLNMGQMNQMSQDQQGTPPVVMVMPQGQGAAGGMMGMMQANSNPFNVLAGQQRPMQVILGNLPAFNPDVFGQQILQGVGGAFGQGMIPQNMGIMSQQQQQPSQQFNRFNDNSGPGRSNFNNSSDRSNNSSRGQNRSSSSNMGNRSSGRRSDSNANNRNSDGRGGVGGNNSTPSRDQRKRGGAVLRDPIPDDAIDRKRAKHSGNQQNNKGNNRNNRGQQNRTGNNAGNKNKKTNNKQNNKVNDKAKKEDDKDKKDAKGDDKKAEESKDKKDIKEEKTEDMDTSNVEEDGKEKQKEKKVSKYDEFPASLLVCKICQKVMNDGSSFESHLNGRAHLALVKILEQRFQKRTELLMQESKLAEDEIGVEMERQRRAGKNNQSGKNSKNYCKMCDCNYMVNWGTHKVSLGHRILKEFLHPTCRICNAHFVHRADWIAHLITLSHLRRLVELKGEGADMTCHESATQDELFAISIDMSGDDHITNAITIKPIEPLISVKDDMTAMLNNGKDELAIPEGEVVIPATYDEEVPVGEEAIMTVAGTCCKVCRLYIADEAEVQPHLKSKTHFNIYVNYLKQVVKAREQKAEEEKRAAEEAEKKAKKEKEDEEKKATEEAEKAAKAEAETTAAVADGEKKEGEAEEIKEEKAAVDEKLESIVEKPEAETMDTSAVAEEKGEFVVEEEIGGDEEPGTNGITEETKVESTPAKTEEKEAEIKVEEKPEEKKDEKAEVKKEAETKPADKKVEPVATTPKQQNNQSRGRGATRGPGGGRGRGANTPNVNKPASRVDTPMRGGRGQNNARSPRGGNQRGGNTGGGNWRGGARGGRGRPFQR